MKTYKTLAVCSGKGGVGKSTISFYLAQLLKTHNLKVGLIDADVYGPSLHLLFGDSLKELKPQINQHLYIAPVVEGVKFMSSAFIAPGGAFIRAPKATAIVQSFFDSVDWGELDLLIIDFPPGTGDIALSLFQDNIIDGAFVVTTPHTLSVEDTAKSCVHLQKSGIDILGVIENMSYIKVGEHKAYPFGSGGAKELCEIFNLNFLLSLPLIAQSHNSHLEFINYLQPLFSCLMKKVLNNSCQALRCTK